MLQARYLEEFHVISAFHVHILVIGEDEEDVGPLVGSQRSAGCEEQAGK